jgi:hypothetical protein
MVLKPKKNRMNDIAVFFIFFVWNNEGTKSQRIAELISEFCQAASENIFEKTISVKKMG